MYQSAPLPGYLRDRIGAFQFLKPSAMHISAAELETTVMRAAIGAGVEYGIAIEIGKAAVALSDHGIDASTVIATALENLDRQDANGFAVDDACNGIFLSKARYLSAILAGSSIGDLLASGQDKIIARNLDVPILAVSLLAARHLDVNAHTVPTISQPPLARTEGSRLPRTRYRQRHPGDIEFSRGFLEGSTDQVRTATPSKWMTKMASDHHVCRSVFGIRIRNVTAAEAGAGLTDED